LKNRATEIKTEQNVYLINKTYYNLLEGKSITMKKIIKERKMALTKKEILVSKNIKQRDR
jgi:hypothetical protein